MSASSRKRPTFRISRDGERLVHDAVHEFHTPLTVVREFASMIADGLCDSGSVSSDECVRAILDASGELLDMFESFRGVAAVRSEVLAAERKPCTLPAIWEEIRPAIEPRAAERGVRLETDIDPGAAPIEVDRRQIGRALRCILRSGIRSTPAGGSVRLWVRRRSKSFVAIGCLDGGPELSQSDLRLFEEGEIGTGIERRSRICTFGLDLELARVVAESNGGRLHLRPGPGGGRACLLLLPVVNAARKGASRHRPRRSSKTLERSR